MSDRLRSRKLMLKEDTHADHLVVPKHLLMMEN